MQIKKGSRIETSETLILNGGDNRVRTYDPLLVRQML